MRKHANKEPWERSGLTPTRLGAALYALETSVFSAFPDGPGAGQSLLRKFRPDSRRGTPGKFDQIRPKMFLNRRRFTKIPEFSLKHGSGLPIGCTVQQCNRAVAVGCGSLR